MKMRDKSGDRDGRHKDLRNRPNSSNGHDNGSKPQTSIVTKSLASDFHGSVQRRARRIALVTMRVVDREALCYVLNACQRMEACLDVLTDLPQGDVNQAVVAVRDNSDITWRTIQIGSTDEVSLYAGNEPGLLFLASGISDREAHRLRQEWVENGRHANTSWVVVENRRQ